MPTFDPKPTQLVGRGVVLEPLGDEHASDLLAVGRDASIWTWMPRGAFVDLQDVLGWIAASAKLVTSGDSVSFAIRPLVDGVAGAAIGSTRFLDIQRADLGLEIGWTWLATSAQRTGVNTECKLLLQAHAFEDLGAARVQLKTDSLNLASQRAMERIGAKREGVLRRHRRVELEGGGVRWRDSVYYSIIESEWPEVKAGLLEKMRS